MERIWLDDSLNIKKLDPNDSKDVWLVSELDKDELISGENGYLWPMGNIFNDVKYLSRNDIYASPYGIYYQNKPVGYIELSDIITICHKKILDISYALLEKERGKGYATRTLLETTKMLLTVSDIDKVSLIIDSKNKQSQRVAEQSGFIVDHQVDFEDMIGYQKTKLMVKY